jgi:hypothetical protein
MQLLDAQNRHLRADPNSPFGKRGRGDFSIQYVAGGLNSSLFIPAPLRLCASYRLAFQYIPPAEALSSGGVLVFFA